MEYNLKLVLYAVAIVALLIWILVACGADVTVLN
jgi:hypothetical protein